MGNRSSGLPRLSIFEWMSVAVVLIDFTVTASSLFFSVAASFMVLLAGQSYAKLSYNPTRERPVDATRDRAGLHRGSRPAHGRGVSAGAGARRAAHRLPDVQQGDGVHAGRARCARAAGDPAAARRHAGAAGGARRGQLPAQDRRPRALHPSHLAPRPERNALLPRARGPSRGAPPDRLHTDGGARVPAVRTHL